MKIATYTFKTFPFTSQLTLRPFIFSKLKEDLISFQKIIENESPSLILGLAKAKRTSQFEKTAVNKFNKNKTINNIGKESYPLYYPENGFKTIQISNSYTTSFCNWTMYKISELLEHTEIKLSFIHISEKDLPVLNEYLKNLISK